MQLAIKKFKRALKKLDQVAEEIKEMLTDIEDSEGFLIKAQSDSADLLKQVLSSGFYRACSSMLPFGDSECHETQANGWYVTGANAMKLTALILSRLRASSQFWNAKRRPLRKPQKRPQLSKRT